MSSLQCDHCGQGLALADAQCSACGTAVPAEQRLSLLMPRAESLAEQERFAEAARALDTVLALDLPLAEKKSLGRKKAAWLRKAALTQPALLDGAEAALAEVLRLDDNDDLSHQVWIDLLVQRGLGDKAKTWYQQRLQLNPEDGMATRQMAVLKLASDFKAQPVAVKSALVDEEPKFLLWRMVVPNTTKTMMMGFNAVFCLAMLIRSLAATPVDPTAPIAPTDPEMAAITGAATGGMGDLFKSIDDPWSWGVQLVLSAAYVYWGLTRRKRA